MANAAILYDNLADAGTVTASSWIAAAPPATLQSHHVSRRWKGRNGDSEYVLTGLLASFDTIRLGGIQGVIGDDQINLTSAAVSRVRVSSADATGVAGDIYDSGSAAGELSARFGTLTKLLPSVVSGYVRIDVSEAGASAILGGRLIVGRRNNFGINFDWNWTSGYGDLSRVAQSAGGLDFVDLDDTYRVLNVTFSNLSESERRGFVDSIDRLNGIKKDVLFIVDTASADIEADSIWGRVQDMNPPTQAWIDRFGKSYTIKERR